MTYISGNQSFVKGAFEDKDVWTELATAMTQPDSTKFAFGQGVDISISRSNNKVRNYGIGNRNAQSTSDLQYSGTATINGAITNFYWLLGILGANANGGVVGAYTHTYTEADILPTFCLWRRINFDIPKNEVLQGCVINQASINSSLNETVKFSLECPFRYSKLDTATESQVTDTQKVFTFAGGTIETPTGTEIAAIQNFELTIVNNAEMIYGLGSRFAQGFIAKNREYNFKFTAAIKDFSLLSKFYDGTTGTAPDSDGHEITSMKLTFVNSDDESAIFTFVGVHFNEETLPTSPNDFIKEDITGWCNSLTNVVYTNTVELAPAEATNVA